MSKKSWVALLLVAALAFGGCALTVKDTAKDNARVVLSVNDKTINKGTFNYVVEQTIAQNDYYNQMYQSMFGYSMGYDTSEASVRQTVLEQYKQLFIEQIKIEETGLDQLSDEEKATAKEAAQTEYDSLIDQIIASYLTDKEGKDDETLRAEAIAYAEANANTLDDYILNQENTISRDKLRESVVKDVAVSDEELQAALDEQVASATETYASSPSAYGYAVNNGSTVYYAPAGYRYVKQILVKFLEADQTLVTEANTALTTANTALTEAQTAYDTALADSEANAEADPAILADAKAALAEKQAAADAAKKTADDTLAAAQANIQPRVQEVMDKIAAGEDFDALMETYNEDPGMQREPGKTNGYAICDGYTYFETAFTDAGMALAGIGDVSEPVASANYGYFILKYVSDIAEGPVALDAVRAKLTDTELAEKKETVYADQIAAWLADADVKTYLERLDQ